jgi:hypothetical protein
MRASVGYSTGLGYSSVIILFLLLLLYEETRAEVLNIHWKRTVAKGFVSRTILPVKILTNAFHSSRRDINNEIARLCIAFINSSQSTWNNALEGFGLFERDALFKRD